MNRMCGDDDWRSMLLVRELWVHADIESKYFRMED